MPLYVPYKMRILKLKSPIAKTASVKPILACVFTVVHPELPASAMWAIEGGRAKAKLAPKPMMIAALVIPELMLRSAKQLTHQSRRHQITQDIRQANRHDSNQDEEQVVERPPKTGIGGPSKTS